MSSKRIKVLEEIAFPQVEEMLRNITLKGRSDWKPYLDASFSLQTIPPDFIRPVGNYVVKRNLRFQYLLREILMTEYGIDTLHMNRDDSVRIAFNTPNAVECLMIPPTVEVSNYDGGLPIMMDGQHRVYGAIVQNIPDISAIIIRNADVSPYYGHPLKNGWSEVKEYTEVPESAAKRDFRLTTLPGHPSIHYKLYRDLEPIGVGRPRTKDEKKLVNKLIKFMEED